MLLLNYIRNMIFYFPKMHFKMSATKKAVYLEHKDFTGKCLSTHTVLRSPSWSEFLI